MEKELVSVIIPSYNSEKTIKLCLDAIYQQDYPNFEVIVVDDCSTDNSPRIIQEYPCQLIRTPKNIKVSAARNLGVQHAGGRYYFFVDSDVKLFPDAISNLVREFQKNPEIGCVCGMYAKTPLINDSIFEEYRTLQNHYWHISSEGYATPGNFALGGVRSDVFQEIGGFNPKLTQCEDVEYGHRINQKYKLIYTSKVMGQHDHDDKLTVIMKKLFERARQRIPFYFKRRQFSKGFETGSRAVGIMLAFLSVCSLALAFFNPAFLFLPGLLFIGFLSMDFKQYLFVLQERKVPFTLFFIGVHYLVNVNISLGLCKGILDWMFKKDFRNNYEMV